MFVADGRPITVGDIVLAAHGRGELQPAWTRLLVLLECEQQAEIAEGEEEGPDDERLQAMSDQFRYERDLITAEETERWLEDRGLTLDDFNAHLLRHYWADTFDELPEPEPLDYASAADHHWDLLIAELLLSGELDRMALQLSWRFAAAHVEPDPLTAHPAEHQPASVRPRDDSEHWFSRLGCSPRWLDDLERLEAAYQRECERLLTPAHLERVFASMRAALTRIDLETLDVDSPDAVREVVMCVREDGMSMSEVASEAGYPYERTEVLVEDLPADVQRALLSATPGEMLEPLPHEGGFHVRRLVARIDANLEDDEIRERVERRLLERHFSDSAAGTVRWSMAPSGTP